MKMKLDPLSGQNTGGNDAVEWREFLYEQRQRDPTG